jgi:hypothetical protein
LRAASAGDVVRLRVIRGGFSALMISSIAAPAASFDPET